VDRILEVLKRATYYSILAPLSTSFRQAVLRVEETELDNSQTPEVASLRSLARLAADARHTIRRLQVDEESAASVFATLAEIPDGQSILEQFNQFLDRYGYLSEAAPILLLRLGKKTPDLFGSCLLSFSLIQHRSLHLRNSRVGKLNKYKHVLISKVESQKSTLSYWHTYVGLLLP
jgi:hypothetical protein